MTMWPIIASCVASLPLINPHGIVECSSYAHFRITPEAASHPGAVLWILRILFSHVFSSYYIVDKYCFFKSLPVIVAWMFRFSISRYLGLSGNQGNNMSCMNVGTTTRERNKGQCSSCVEQPNDNDKRTKIKAVTNLFNMAKRAGKAKVQNKSIISVIFTREKI